MKNYLRPLLLVLIALTLGTSSAWGQSGRIREPSLTISLSFRPESVTGGKDVTGTVTISRDAGAGGLLVLLSTSDTKVARPRVNSVTIRAGKRDASFTVLTSKVTAPKSVFLGAEVRNVTSTKTSLRVDR
jgi:hypothetical protein